MNPEERDALLELLSHVFESNDDIDGLVYLDIQKILYHLRERLNDDNAVRELLPYYWYIDGTVSDTVQEAVNHGLETGVLEASPTTRTGAGEWYELSAERTPSAEGFSRDDLEAAKREIERTLEEDYNIFANHEEKIEGIYEDAPYDFQRYFKLNILFAVEQFASGRPLYLGTENLASEIGTAEAYLPLHPAFEGFNRIFSRYVNISKRYLKLVNSDSREFADRFKQLSEGVWRLYCQQLRLQEHDPYYDSKTDDWSEEYERTKQLVANDLVEFRELLDLEFEDGEETARVSEESTWGKIAADYLDDPELSE
jgi:hypothetical protein